VDTSGGYLARTNIPYTPYHRNNAWYEDGRAACRGVIGSWHIILNNNFCINIRYNEHLALAAYIMNIMVPCEKTNFSSSANRVLSYSIGQYMVSSMPDLQLHSLARHTPSLGRYVCPVPA
jgi:hypothetical protein